MKKYKKSWINFCKWPDSNEVEISCSEKKPGSAGGFLLVSSPRVEYLGSILVKKEINEKHNE